ncbi:retrovirus-related pol polyprotein from transposon TNT 1-94 [Tanacetum coccineum]|uniref:Retrovirus-related pol polyprotein from transposon TNT 1-94 n=1 Tax=Tanacetum coccineum TaxID=301880 RepID=A0ABQ5HP41_9ASTR
MLTWKCHHQNTSGFKIILLFNLLLSSNSTRYALTTNPTIYVSLIEQFWQTTIVKTVSDGEQQIIVTVDGQTIAITEASVRRHLQLADAEGISSLPNTKNFELTLMGYVSNNDKLTFQKGGDTPGSDEGSKKLNELMKLCTKLFDKVTSLEKDLKQTKKVYGKALTKLVKKKNMRCYGLRDPIQSVGGLQRQKNEDVDVETEYEEVEYELDQTATYSNYSCKFHTVRNIKEAYQAFEDMPQRFDEEDLVPIMELSSVTPTLALTNFPANVEGENATNTATEEPSTHTEGDTKDPKMATPRIDKGKGIATESDKDPSKKRMTASSIVHPDPDEQVKVEFMINGKMVYLTEQEIQDYWDKEEQIKKAKEQARLLAIFKPKVIKVVQEEAEKIRHDQKKITSSKARKKFKKAQDAEHQVLKRYHSKKVRKSLELKKHKYDSYMWTINSRLKPEPITDIKIHLKTKPVVITVYRGTDGRNFDVHNPFIFGKFGISELDELREIIPKKKNVVVKDLMNSLSQRYKRIRKILNELGIQSALPAPVPEQASSQTSRRKRKRMELEPKVKVHGLECNKSLPEGVLFVNNMVIEDPEYGIFFIDVFVRTQENARFFLKLRKLIANHPDQEKLKSKKVKLEALGYKMDWGTDTAYLLLSMANCNPSRNPVDTNSKLGDDGDPVICLYMHDPREPYFSSLKRILRHVRGTLDHGLQLFSSSTTSLVAYSDADWVGCPATRRSTFGYCVFLGNNLLS